MTREAALTKLQVLAQWQVHPKLNLDELNVCLDGATRGSGSWDFATAARDAWQLKAAKASDHHSSTVSGRRFEANQIFDNCLAQARAFAKRIHGSMHVQHDEEAAL